MKAHMDQMGDCSLAYIQEWQRLRAELLNGTPVPYWPWELVAPAR